MKNILIVSPTPTHPTNAGSRIWTFQLSEYLKEQGHNVRFIYVDYESYDEAALVNYWKQDIRIVQQSTLNKSTFFFRVTRFFANRLLNFKYVSLSILGVYSKSQLKYNIPTSRFYNKKLFEIVQNELMTNKIDVLIVNYVWFGWLLNAAGKNVKKLILTHDIFSDRFKIYQNSGLEPQWISLYPIEERNLINKADTIVAIQEKEANFYRSITNKKVITIGSFFNLEQTVDPDNKVVLFVGSSNVLNVNGINYFIEHIFPKIIAHIPEVELLIAGKIVEKKEDILNCGNVKYIGEFVSAKEIYEKASVVICPIYSGTGLKIKLIESLSYGKPTVVSSHVAEPFSNLKERFFLIGDTDESFSKKVIELLDCKDKRASVIKGLTNFKIYYQNNEDLSYFKFQDN